MKKTIKCTPQEIIKSIWTSRSLITASVKRDITGRYKGSSFGMMWAVFNPVLMILVYTFVFTNILNSRWGQDANSKADYALLMFVGLIIFNMFSECVSRAPSLILNNVNFVKKIVYPIEVLPVVVVISSFYHALVSMVVWILAYWIAFGYVNLTVVFAPFIILPFCFLLCGISWVLAALGVYLRDMAQIISAVISALLFMSPVFYPASAFPVAYEKFVYFNPLTIVIEQLRVAMFFGNAPEMEVLYSYTIISLVAAWAGFTWFQKTKKGFADVI